MMGKAYDILDGGLALVADCLPTGEGVGLCIVRAALLPVAVAALPVAMVAYAAQCMVESAKLKRLPSPVIADWALVQIPWEIEVMTQDEYNSRFGE